VEFWDRPHSPVANPVPRGDGGAAPRGSGASPDIAAPSPSSRALFFRNAYLEFRWRSIPGFTAPHHRCFQTRRHPMLNAKRSIDAGYETTSFQLCEAMSNMNET
jgi:hypothetical protein